MVNSNTEVENNNELEFLNLITKSGNSKQHSTVTIQTVPVESTAISKHDVEAVNIEITEQANSFKKASCKQRKFALEEFRQQFMRTNKIDNRKPVFISETIRNDLDRIVRLFGERGLSVSGLVENLTRHFLETYKDDVEQWRKM